MSELKLTIVVPAYNEAENLARSLPQLCGLELPALREIIIVDDGSTDATPQLVQDAAERDSRVRLVQLPHNQGKGAAVRAGLLAAQCEAVLYTDADLVYRLGMLREWLGQLAQYDMVNGNRVLDASVLHVPTRLIPYVAKRARLGPIFNKVVRMLLDIQSSDTQGGLKMFRRDIAQRLARTAQDTGFAFDVEFFALAQLWNLRILEAPVQLDYRSDASQVRVFYHGIRMLKALFDIRWRIRRLRRKSE